MSVCRNYLQIDEVEEGFPKELLRDVGKIVIAKKDKYQRKVVAGFTVVSAFIGWWGGIYSQIRTKNTRRLHFPREIILANTMCL